MLDPAGMVLLQGEWLMQAEGTCRIVSREKLTALHVSHCFARKSFALIAFAVLRLPATRLLASKVGIDIMTEAEVMSQGIQVNMLNIDLIILILVAIYSLRFLI